ncbi:unnamed protein product [[Candida] boidinii]|uniref:Unnamed protein product n=1 Tax=Candida boidinii TaxID=5477 RepID=A0A9W6WG13_CANBO|nr:hypothetical protein B5S30_g855 [[Candida] boidinii]OWB86951.1 hypothetical protein B5S33_g5678 [[Candida] boidinii]GME67812.1 unnamed protein product [[Candida] boidinii]GMF49475.1 unnamed protein product [[Candida] boidinii]GMF98270.1 unnamed protein product [[Candida] boidinii]
MSGNPGNKISSWSTTPPDRGSFPLDHFGDCTEQMKKYLNCLKIVRNDNAPNCRLLAKDYLECRMQHELMDRVSWDRLGLPDDKATNNSADSNTATATASTSTSKK